MQASDIMTKALVTATPDTQIDEVARLMTEQGISGVPIADEDGAVIGIVSEGDLLRRVEGAADRPRGRLARLFLGDGLSATDFVQLRGQYARDVMTRDVVTVPPDMPVGEIARLLQAKHIKRVPVVMGGRLVGLVSRANLLHALAQSPRHPMPPGADDAALRDALLEEIGKVPGIIMAHIQVIVQHGKGVVRGLVASEAQRQATRVAAESVGGSMRLRSRSASRRTGYGGPEVGGRGVSRRNVRRGGSCSC